MRSGLGSGSNKRSRNTHIWAAESGITNTAEGRINFSKPDFLGSPSPRSIQFEFEGLGIPFEMTGRRRATQRILTAGLGIEAFIAGPKY